MFCNKICVYKVQLKRTWLFFPGKTNAVLAKCGRLYHPSCAYVKIFTPFCLWLLCLKYICVMHMHHIFIFMLHGWMHWANILHQLFPSSNHLEDSSGLWQWCYGQDSGGHIQGSYNCFKHGSTSVESKAYSDRPSICWNKVMIKNVQGVIMETVI